MNNLSIILVSVGMLCLFLVPFFMISHDRKEEHRKQEDK